MKKIILVSIMVLTMGQAWTGCGKLWNKYFDPDNEESSNRFLGIEPEPPPATTPPTPPPADVPTYKAPPRVSIPEGQGTIKVANLQCPGAEYQSENDGGTAVNLVKLKDGNCYAAWQFEVEPAHEGRCDAWHLHDGRVKAINGTTATDPLPGEGACGFGKLNAVQEGVIYINPEQYKRVYNR